MNKVLPLFFILFSTMVFSQDAGVSFQRGEFLKYKIHYGLLNAGFSTMQLEETTEENDSIIHAVGKGWTTGMAKFFFRVEDTYESYFDVNNFQPKHFIRKVNEGGYTQDKEI